MRTVGRLREAAGSAAIGGLLDAGTARVAGPADRGVPPSSLWREPCLPCPDCSPRVRATRRRPPTTPASWSRPRPSGRPSPATARSARRTCSALPPARRSCSPMPRAARSGRVRPTDSAASSSGASLPEAATRSAPSTVSRWRATAPFRVLSPSGTPPASFYSSQHLAVGLNYLTMRDGVRLAATVRLPTGQDSRRRSLPDGDRGVGLRDRRTAQPHRRRAPPERRDHLGPPGSRHGDRGRVADRSPARVRDGQPADARDRMLGGRLRPLRPADHLRRLRRGADRRRRSRGSPTTRSAWWGSPSRASPRCSSPGPAPRGWRRSRR